MSLVLDAGAFIAIERAHGVGGPAGCKEAAKRCTERNRTVGPTLKEERLR